MALSFRDPNLPFPTLVPVPGFAVPRLCRREKEVPRMATLLWEWVGAWRLRGGGVAFSFRGPDLPFPNRPSVSKKGTKKVENQAFTFAGKPIYCTQFHPEMAAADLIQRLRAYPQYLEKITGWTIDEFRKHCHETPDTVLLLSRFSDSLCSISTPGK